MNRLKTFLPVVLACVCFSLSSNSSRACTFTASFTGPLKVCPGNSVNYLSKLTSGHYYRWIVNGGAVVSGKGTDSIMVYWPAPGTGSVKLIDSTSSCFDTITQNIIIGVNSAFLTATPFNVKSSASAPSSGRLYTVTPNSTNLSGALWSKYGINLNYNFDLTVTTNQNGGADGMMFVMQNKGNTVSPSANQGSDLGYYEDVAGDFSQSIGVEEDLYNSATASPSGFADSSAGHLNLVRNDSFWPMRKQVNISGLGSGKDHKLRVTWNKDVNLLEVYFDGTKEFSWPNNIIKNVFGGNPNVWFGYTGATGGVSATQTIYIDTLIYNEAVINTPKDTICQGDSATLTANQGAAYSWSTGGKTRAIKVGKSGTYIVTITDSFGCTTTASHTITVMPSITAAFSVANGCLGYNVSITNSSTPASGLRYVWYFGNGDSATGNPPTYQYKSTGNYTLSVSATNGGCISKASNPISVYNHPSGIIFSKSTPFQGQFNTGDLYKSDNACIGDTNTYEILPPVGYTNADYGTKWTITSKTFATTAGTLNTDTVFKNPTASTNAYFQFLPRATFADSVLILTLHVRLMPGNCDTDVVRYIEARTKAVSQFLFTNACEGSALLFHDTSTLSGGDIISSWNWDFGDGSTSLSQNPYHAYSKSGTYKVTLLATSNTGCGIPITQTVSQYPNPVAAFHAATGCQQTSSVFTDSSSIASGSITTHAWTFGNGSGSALASPSFTYPKSGPYQVKLVVISAFGCKDSLTKAIRVEPLPVAGFIYNSACVGSAINFSNRSTDSTTGTKYQWNFGDGTAISTATLPSHVFTANGTYKTKLTAISKYGCADTIIVKVTPYAETVPNIVYSGACTKTAVAFGDSDKNDAGATYTWNFGDGASDAVGNDTDSHIYTKTGNFKVMLTIQNGDGCVDTQSKSITILSFPVASFSLTNVCVGKPLTFNNTTTGTGLTYSWNFGDTTSGKLNSSALPSPAHTYDTSGTFNVTLWATNPAGCTDSISQTTNVVAPPTVLKWAYKIHNNMVTFTPKDTTQQTYKWYFGTGDSTSTKKPAYTYPGKGTYDVKLVETNATGCSASYSDSVTLTGAGVELVSGPKNNLNISIFPNPFESKTSINYTLTGSSRVNVSIFDIQGKLVAELRDGNYEAGKYQDEFDAVKYNATDGVYLVKMTVNGEVFTGRIMEMR